MKFIKIILILIIGNSLYAVPYLDSTFSSIKADLNIKYGSNYNYQGDKQDLPMDIYQPEKDTSHLRPLIIWVHGGSFIGGNRKEKRIIDFCKFFAKRGYLAAAIDYRVGFDFSDRKNIKKNIFFSVLRAVQDTKAAVRYFRKFKDKYRIDTSKITVGGISAGGFAALQAAYINTKELPPQIDTTSLGDLEGNSGNPGYSSYFQAVVNCWGGIADTAWIPKHGQPVICFHGTNDPMVPFNEGMVFNLIKVYGSKAVYESAIHKGIKAEFYPFKGAGHGPPPDKIPFVLQKIDEFLYEVFFKKK